MLVFDELETTRSVQLYGTDPVYVGKAAEILCAEYGVAHIDLNFGCPVPKVTRKGGGGALPWKRGLLAEILTAAVAAATPYDVPVTMKTRKGLDDDHLTYLDAGRIAQETGRRGDRAARADRRAVLLRRGRLGGDRPPRRARRHPGARQRRHLGGRRRAADGRADRRRRRRGRPRLPGPAVAVPRPRGGVRRRRGRRRCRRSARCATMMRRHAELLCAAHGGGARLQGVPQARLVVPQGLRRRRHAAPRAGAGHHAGRARRAARRARPGRAVPGRRAGHAARPPGLARGPRSCCPRAGSTTPTAPARGSARTPGSRPAAERAYPDRDATHPGDGRVGIRTCDFACASLGARCAVHFPPDRRSSRTSPCQQSAKEPALWPSAASGAPMPAASPRPPSWPAPSPSWRPPPS